MIKRRTAVLLDGGHVLFEISRKNGTTYTNVLPTKDEVLDLAHACLAEEEDLFRIYYYDCQPYGGEPFHPVLRQKVDFKTKPAFINRSHLYEKLAQEKNIAFRAGQLKFRGWNLKKEVFDRFINRAGRIGEYDLAANLQ